MIPLSVASWRRFGRLRWWLLLHSPIAVRRYHESALRWNTGNTWRNLWLPRWHGGKLFPLWNEVAWPPLQPSWLSWRRWHLCIGHIRAIGE